MISRHRFILVMVLLLLLVISCLGGCVRSQSPSPDVESDPKQNTVSGDPAEKQTTDNGSAQTAATPAIAPTMAPAAPDGEYETGEVLDAYMFAAEAPMMAPPIEFNTEEYDYQEESGFHLTAVSPLSTFAADVDTASYANFRRQVLQSGSVNPSSVRIEEMVNYFRYGYREPEQDEPFGVAAEIAPCPWNDKAELLMIGLQAKKLDTGNMPQSNLVFLIDVSGSMDSPNKLPLVQRSFMTLVENLDQDDRVSIITYASGETILLDGEPADHKATILAALENLEARGATYGEKALITAYEIAEKNFIKDGNNRIIMATDGDFNVGQTDTGELTTYVAEQAKEKNISLSVLGYGMGNYKDNRLESIADHGRGNYAYIDSIDEARKVLVDEAGGTLFTVAKDVKIQVDFNPEFIKAYRLIGYENRTMAAEDFANDKKSGGEIGAGHQVTALYEIIPVGSDFDLPAAESKYTKKPDAEKNGDGAPETQETDELLTINIRYKKPDADTSILLEYPITRAVTGEKMSDDMSWAAGVAQIGMLIKNSEYSGTSDMNEVRERLKTIDQNDDFREEFIYLIRRLNSAK